jgi:hypothetical protein
MPQTATVARPVVSLFARCTFCVASTPFRCLRCGSAMCPDCVPGDFCPECRPAPVAPLLGWSLVNEGNGAEDALVVAVACVGCGDVFRTEDADDLCAACLMPAAELAALRMVPAPAPVACLLCGQPISRGDADEGGTRHAQCARFLTLLAARHAERNGGDAIAA